MEVKYNLDKNFVFDGRNKIESVYDVAFLFRKLEQSAVENLFAVYITDNNKPIIQHISMGNISSTAVWFSAISDGIDRFKPLELRILHNHPSGNIQPSEADINILKTIDKNFPQLKTQGIIIDVDSGIFGVFSPKLQSYDNYSVVNEANDQTFKQLNNIVDTTKYNVLKFDKQVFKENVSRDKIRTASDVASLVASQRLSCGDKLSVLIISNANKIHANIHIPYSNFDNPQLVRDISVYCGRFAGNSVIFYGRIENDLNLKYECNKLKSNLKEIQINFLDFINFQTSPQIVSQESDLKYLSYADDGILNEKQYSYAIKNAEVMYNKYNPQINNTSLDVNQNANIIDFDITPVSKSKGMSM